ncbi:TPA: hypothetical protein ACNTXA_005627, partial [Klebsiella pneumoniae]|nr:hypothetical protein [Klebsiella pneumoniae]
LLIADAFGRLTLASYFTHCFLLVCQHNKFPPSEKGKATGDKKNGFRTFKEQVARSLSKRAFFAKS